MRKKSIFNVRVDEDTLERFKRKCEADNLTQTSVINAFIDLYINDKVKITKQELKIELE